MRGVIPPLPNTPSWRGAQFKKKHRDIFIFTFTPNTGEDDYAEKVVFHCRHSFVECIQSYTLSHVTNETREGGACRSENKGTQAKK
jgi:hypothetical protein